MVQGSMFGGKTERLIACLRAARAQGLRVMAFKHCIDNRYDSRHLVTHTQDRFEAVPVPNAESIVTLSEGMNLVAIDEGHFFKKALVDVVRILLDKGTSVIIAGITYDAWGRPFEPMPQLVAFADEVVTRQAPCRVCGCPAPYTQRMMAVYTEHMVGGVGEYEPRCSEHFIPLSCPPEVR